jgi:hypothetical protein
MIDANPDTGDTNRQDGANDGGAGRRVYGMAVEQMGPAGKVRCCVLVCPHTCYRRSRAMSVSMGPGTCVSVPLYCAQNGTIFVYLTRASLTVTC